jgi:nucleoside-diphosphate-sugar epimerase
MQIVVTGGGSPLGQALLHAILARALLRRVDGEAVPVRRIIAVDRTQPANLLVDDRIEYVRGDYELPRFLPRMMGAATDSVFHLAPLGAADGVAPDAGGLEALLSRSLDTTRALVEACRFQTAIPTLVYAGLDPIRPPADRATCLPPESATGICVAMCELLLVESARRGIVDLRSLRLPGAFGDGAEASVPPQAAAAALVDAHELPRGGAPGRIRTLSAAG